LGKLYYYAIFHANLSFSCIAKDQYAKILDKCYWPIADLVGKGYKLGLEFSSSTLLAISRVDPSFIEEISSLWMDGKCDIIGSGVIQNIFPLIPDEVNRVNLSEARKDYIKLFGRMPEIGFVNEQTYSAGIPEIFSEAGYKSIIMDWDNASEYNNYPLDLRYHPVLVKYPHGKCMPVIWNSSLNSYKFQRCIYNRLSIDDFVTSVMSHRNPGHDRALTLYGTDWEIFDYRPGTQQDVHGEIEKIEKLLRKLAECEYAQLATASEILKKFPPEQVVKIETPECPVPCKNRDDYNALRWAVSGRDNVYLNTQCYKIYNKLKLLEFFNGLSDGNNQYWRELNELWGSDLRTKTTDEKYYGGRMKIGEISRTLDLKVKNVFAHFKPNDDFILINHFEDDWNYEPFEMDISFRPGERFGELGVAINSEPVKTQCEHKEFYRDGSIRRVKLVICPFIKSGYAVEGRFFEAGNLKTEKLRNYSGSKLSIKTDSVKLVLAGSTGADIRELAFPNIHNKPLIGYLPPVYYDHIGHSSDYYSGGIHISDTFGRTYNDTIPSVLKYPENLDDYNIRIPVICEIDFGLGICWKTYYIYRDMPRVDLYYRFYLKDLSPIFFRLGIMTFNPEAFAKDSLRFTTVNGFDMPEHFYTAGKMINHHLPVGSLSSARTCLGATEGWVDISDDEKGVTIATDKSLLYSVPMVEFEDVKQSYLMRLYHTISESDETGRIHWRGHNTAQFSMFGHNGNLSATRSMVNHHIRKLGCILKNSNQSIEKIEVSGSQSNISCGEISRIC